MISYRVIFTCAKFTCACTKVKLRSVKKKKRRKESSLDEVSKKKRKRTSNSRLERVVRSLTKFSRRKAKANEIRGRLGERGEGKKKRWVLVASCNLFH